jgi:hypothetical protein
MRVLRVVSSLISLAALAACTSPMAPAPVTAPCLSGKVPYATCENRDYVNPLGDYVNPLGDYVNPLGSLSVKPGE